MNAVISKVGKLHMSGPTGRKRWRVKYWTNVEEIATTSHTDASKRSIAFQRVVEKKANLLIVSRFIIPPLRWLIDLLLPLFFGGFAIYTLFSYQPGA